MNISKVGRLTHWGTSTDLISESPLPPSALWTAFFLWKRGMKKAPRLEGPLCCAYT